MNSNNSEIGSGPISRASSAASGASGQSAISGLTANTSSSNKETPNPQLRLEEIKQEPNKLTAENLAQLKSGGSEKVEFAET